MRVLQVRASMELTKEFIAEMADPSRIPKMVDGMLAEQLEAKIDRSRWLEGESMLHADEDVHHDLWRFTATIKYVETRREAIRRIARRIWGWLNTPLFARPLPAPLETP